MSLFLKNTAFHGILLDALFDSDCPEKKELVRLVSEGIKNGAVRPLPATVFSEQQIEQGEIFVDFLIPVVLVMPVNNIGKLLVFFVCNFV